jgi:ankyrin repeat protein
MQATSLRVRHFIEVGSSVNMSDRRQRYRPTALHSCTWEGNIEMAQLLIQHGVDMSPVNDFGETPLHYVVSGRHCTETWVRLLVDAGANISASSEFYYSILYMATTYGTASIVQLLLHRGAIPTLWNSDGGTLLHVPVLYRTAGTVGLFLEAGLNIEARNRRGETPLHRAAKSGREEYVQELLKWGANVDAFDNDGRTPLQAFLNRNRSTSAACHIVHHETLTKKCSSKGSQVCVPGCRSTEFEEPVVDL